jgi:hypothetical protein
MMECRGMADGRNGRGRGTRCGGIAAALLLATGLAGCAGGASSSLLVDPSRYDLYSCKQLGTARKGANDRVVELEGLMAKAETGAGGALASGLAYQTDYLTARAQRDLIDEKIRQYNCSPADLAPETPGSSQPAPPRAPRRR